MNKLKELRQNQNKSLNMLSDQIKQKVNANVSPQTLMRFENRKADISLSKLISIADYFNVSIDYLVGRSDVR